MTCPRCQRRTVLSHGEPWCVVCGTVTPKPTEAELAEMVASTLPRPGGMRRSRDGAHLMFSKMYQGVEE